MLRKTAPVLIVVFFAFFSLAAQAQQAKPGQEQTNVATAPCAFDFSSGANNTYIRFCVSANGNVPEVETPQGHFQMSFDRHEGYGICNESPAQAYYDYGQYGDSGNWGVATVVSHTAQSVRIARTTADGIWTLTQTFTLVPSTPAVKVAIALKNNTAAARVVYLVRHADLDADWNNTGVDTNNLTATTTGAFAWNSSIPFGTNSGYGLGLENLGQPQFGYLQGFARTTFQPPNPCDFAGDSTGNVIMNLDGSVALAYVETIGARKTKTATMIYRGM